MNLADIIGDHARKRPDHIAIEEDDRQISYLELDQQVDLVAANLLAEGLKPGDFVAVALPDSAQNIITLFALFRAGIGVNPMKMNISTTALAELTKEMSLSAFITTTKNNIDFVRQINITDLFVDHGYQYLSGDRPDDPPAFIVQSSGTTGKPKTFIKTHKEFLYGLKRRAKYWDQNDRYYPIISLNFFTGVLKPIGMIYVGATIVLIKKAKIPDIVREINERKITYLVVTPAHLRQLLSLAEPSRIMFPNLRRMMITTAAISHQERLSARQMMTSNFEEMYGTNEGGLIARATPEDQDKYPDSVGKIVDGVDAEIVDENDLPIANGAIGIIRLRANGFATMYLDNPEANRRAFRQGWFYPGDIGALNDEGYLFFKGRADDVINVSGQKFYPVEVENVLLDHPDITEAAVFSVPHPMYGEAVIACYISERPLLKKNIQKHCFRYLDQIKIPWQLFALSDFPRNDIGKVLKRKLREQILTKL